LRLLSNAAWARRKATPRDDTAGTLRRVAVLLGITRARLPLAVALSLAFGLMLMAALAAELAVAFYAGAANTRALLADKTNLLLDTLENRVESLLRPVEEQLRVVAGEIIDGELVPERMAAHPRTFRSTLAVTPQLAGMVFVRTDFQAFRFVRGKGTLPPEDWSDLEPIRRAMDYPHSAQMVMWGAPAWSENLRQTVINAHVAVERGGRPAGLLFAAVTLDTVVRHVDEISASIGQPVFVLQGRDAVVALPGLDTGLAGPDRPLPLLPESGDAVLAAMWAGSEEPIGLMDDRLRGAVRVVEAKDARWVVFYREIAGFGDRPWVVGTYLPASIAGAEIRRLWRAGLLSLAFVAVAVAATFWLGRRMARPVERLAEAAMHIQALDLDAVPLLPRSHVRELDRAARAFNAMRNGLAWFETYVPHRLVRQLMDNPSPDAVASRQLEVTVLFTDIVGFSRLAEQLDAGEAASLLNRHFELLAGCVAETDGTVDKFLGDGMMAFWGAPLPQPDHARRAVQTALLIRDRLAAAGEATPLRLRVGIHTGMALVGNIGAKDRLNYTLVGDTVNIAQRLEQLGKEIAPDGPIVILAGDATAAHAAPLCRVEPLGPRQLRGRDETVEVFRLG
jgi:class 3 adenylate cyclase